MFRAKLIVYTYVYNGRGHTTLCWQEKIYYHCEDKTDENINQFKTCMPVIIYNSVIYEM